jgi:HK97 family phage major capsid protein
MRKRTVIRDGKEIERSLHEDAAEVLGTVIQSGLRDRFIDTGRVDEWSEDTRVARRKNPQVSEGIGTPLPFSVLSRAGLDSLTSTKGAELALTGPAGFLDLIKSVPTLARIRVISGITWSKVTVPAVSVGSTPYWAAENPGSDATESQPTLTASAQLILRTVTASVTYSRQLLRASLSSTAIGEIVQRDLRHVFGVALESAVLNGAGTNDPLGILNNTNIGTVAFGTNGALVTGAKLAEMIRTVEEADAGDVEPAGAFIMNPRGRERMSTIERASGNGWLIEDTGVLGQWPYSVTPRVPRNLTKGTATTICSALIFGDWDNYVIGEFGSGFDLVVDPFTRGSQGLVKVTGQMYVDAAPLRPEAFVKSTDAL